MSGPSPTPTGDQAQPELPRPIPPDHFEALVRELDAAAQAYRAAAPAGVGALSDADERSIPAGLVMRRRVAMERVIAAYRGAVPDPTEAADAAIIGRLFRVDRIVSELERLEVDLAERPPRSAEGRAAMDDVAQALRTMPRAYVSPTDG